MGIFNFEENLVFYGQFHNNQWNRAIHLIFIPLIFWSSMVLLARCPTFLLTPLSYLYTFNVSFAITTLFLIYYMLLEPVAAALLAPMLLFLTYTANVFAIKTEYRLDIPIGLQLVGWSSQICGHLLLEERRVPAITENFVQSIIIAPFFVFVEMLFVIGYRPALQKRIVEKTKNAMACWRLSRERRISS